MALSAFPNGVSSFGVPLFGDTTTGRIWGTSFFVDASVSGDGDAGTDRAHPKKTIQAALDECTADKGDTVYVRDGAYAETVTMSKNGVRLVGGSRGGVVITGATDATDSLIITGSNCITEQLSVAGYDTGDDISLIGVTGDNCTVKNVYFTEDDGEYQVTGKTANGLVIIGCDFTSPHDTTDGACILLEDSDRCKVFANTMFVAADSDGITLHDADDCWIIGNYAIGSDTASPGAGAFVYILDGGTGMRLMVADNKATLFAAGIMEYSTEVAVHGLGTGDLATTATVDSMEVNNTYLGNDFLGCTVAFDTSE